MFFLHHFGWFFGVLMNTEEGGSGESREKALVLNRHSNRTRGLALRERWGGSRTSLLYLHDAKDKHQTQQMSPLHFLPLRVVSLLLTGQMTCLHPRQRHQYPKQPPRHPTHLPAGSVSQPGPKETGET